MYDSLKNSPSLLKQLFHEKLSAVSYYEEAKMIGRIRKVKGKNKTSANIIFFYNAFRCILKSNINKNFTMHNYVKFGDMSHDITV